MFHLFFKNSKSSGEETRDTLDGLAVGLDTDLAKAYDLASPMHYVRPGLPKTLLLHGALDDMCPVNESRQLAGKLKLTGNDYRYVEYPLAEHVFDIIFPGISPAAKSSTAILMDFVR